MPHLFLAALLMAGLACDGDTLGPLRAGARRVLFIGNSLTYVNDLPRTIADLARSVNAMPLVYRTIAKPDFALEDHWNDGIAARIAADGWEVVVMQQGPSSLIANEEVLRVWPVKLDSAVRTSYRSAAIAAIAVNGIFIPGGEAWRAAWATDPDLALYGDDEFHPSRLATHLVAIVHFAILYDRPATDLPDVADVTGRRLDVPAATVALL